MVKKYGGMNLLAENSQVIFLISRGRVWLSGYLNGTEFIFSKKIKWRVLVILQLTLCENGQ